VPRFDGRVQLKCVAAPTSWIRRSARKPVGSAAASSRSAPRAIAATRIARRPVARRRVVDRSAPPAAAIAPVLKAASITETINGENVVLVASQGLGKTVLTKNLLHQAVLAGHSALFITASDLLLDLNGQDTSRALERRLRAYARPQILAIDEIGYLSYDAHAADLLFQVISRRYEQRSIVVTTNLLSSSGTRCFQTPPVPSPSSTASRTTPRSFRSKGRAIANARPNSRRRSGGPRRDRDRPIGPSTVPVETVKVIRPNHVSGLSRINALQCRKRCTGQQKGSPFCPFRGTIRKSASFSLCRGDRDVRHPDHQKQKQ
jgi:hypothetical protein